MLVYSGGGLGAGMRERDSGGEDKGNYRAIFCQYAACWHANVNYGPLV
ncbi:hypothetical protein [Paenibacillus aceris]|uniref:Uncharacterized protein n=1 Tax=Paenibacillus aceris TaxID=869555 RepID=A0ABS4HUF9_9BACL|nr:hypothetical protein [Paenibacillus aceris]MBP1962190.1 hypothetical protein [Paenibacillus aceris]NHW33965.1 hypothetical protein [Paenibacillus aceris]